MNGYHSWNSHLSRSQTNLFVITYVPLPFTVAFLIQACVAGMAFGFMAAFNTWTRQTCITDERMSLSDIASNPVTLKNIYV